MMRSTLSIRLNPDHGVVNHATDATLRRVPGHIGVESRLAIDYTSLKSFQSRIAFAVCPYGI